MTRPEIQVSAANPGRAPRRYRYVHERGWELQPVTPQQLRKLRAMAADADASDEAVAAMFGDGFTNLAALSKLAASWGIDQFRVFADQARRLEQSRIRQSEDDVETAQLIPNTTPVTDHNESRLKTIIAAHYRKGSF